MDGRELVLALRALGLSQRQIGEGCGLSQGAISHIETGRRKNMLASTERALMALYDQKMGATPAEAPEAA